MALHDETNNFTYDEHTTQDENSQEQGNGHHESASEQENTANEEQHTQCNERIRKLEEQLAYLTSDFTNYKRNVEKEKTQWKHEAQEKILQDLLPVVDDVDRAVADLQSEDLPEEAAKRLEGIQLIHKSIHKLLDEYGVHEITQLEEFDPQWHEAVMQVSETDVSSGNIVSVIQKGYTFNGKLLRTAKVSVAA